MLTRRSMLLLPAALASFGVARNLRASAAGVARRIAVMFPSAVQPCTEALEGMRQRLSGSEVALDLLDVNQPAFVADAQQAMLRKPAVIVAVGSDALRAILAQESSVKTVSTMTLEADHDIGSKPGRVTAAVYLDIPLRTIAAELRRIFPEKTRIGVIRNPDRGISIRGQVPEGGAFEIADCATANELLPVFLAFRKRVDFVVCLPDSSLYNSATARPLIMSSLENRLPIVGFSPAFLRAGAAVAIYPNYRAVGEQTADLVRRCLEPGECAGWEAPRKVDVAVNAKVLRMIGIDFKISGDTDLMVLR
jgi:hypothetical protein